MNRVKYIIEIAVVFFTTAILFSCKNTSKEVYDFLADKNLPIGVAYQINHIHTDSGRVDVKMKAPVMLDFSNRKAHPYSEFPKGIRITTIEKNNDSITISGNYAKNYTKTGIAEIKENVEIINHASKSRLLTNQIFWDQKTHYFFTEKKFTLYTQTDTIYGKGFEALENLTKWWAKKQTGVLNIKE